MKIVWKLITMCLVFAFLNGCAAKRASTGSQPPPPVSTWEQINYDNLQIAVHNRAVAKALVAAYSSGFLDDSYFAMVKQKGIAITQAHQKLTPMLKNLQTAKSNAAAIKAVLQSVMMAAGDIATAAGVKNPQVAQNVITEAQIVESLANSILSLLQGAGVIADGPEPVPICYPWPRCCPSCNVHPTISLIERRSFGPTNYSEVSSPAYSSRRYYSGGHSDHPERRRTWA